MLSKSFFKRFVFCQRLFSKVCYVHIGLFQRVSFKVLFFQRFFLNAFFKRFFLEFFL